MRTYGSITFKDAEGRQAPCRIMNPNDAAGLQAIAGVIEGYSNAVWTKVRVDTENGSVGTPTAAAYKLAKTKAVLSFRNADDEIFKASIPAPVESMFDGDGEVSATVGDAVAASLTTNTANGTLTFLQGKLWHRAPK